MTASTWCVSGRLHFFAIGFSSQLLPAADSSQSCDHRARLLAPRHLSRPGLAGSCHRLWSGRSAAIAGIAFVLPPSCCYPAGWRSFLSTLSGIIRDRMVVQRRRGYLRSSRYRPARGASIAAFAYAAMCMSTCLRCLPMRTGAAAARTLSKLYGKVSRGFSAPRIAFLSRPPYPLQQYERGADLSRAIQDGNVGGLSRGERMFRRFVCHTKLFWKSRHMPGRVTRPGNKVVLVRIIR